MVDHLNIHIFHYSITLIFEYSILFEFDYSSIANIHS